jgi:DNA helicase-2/ATP-dependent DNA helicase PcrA
MALTSEQRSVIQHQNGHAKVMAVAGAGKTTTLVYYVRQCLARGTPPRRILILMYNKAAQLDFQRKLTTLIQPSHVSDSFTDVPEVRTFHSLGLKIYHQLIRTHQLPSFKQDLLTDGEIESTVWRLLQACAPPDTAKDILDQKSKWVEPAVNYIDLVKSTLRPPEEVFESIGLPKLCDFFPKVFRKFEAWRKEQGRISFSDMLYDPCKYFEAHPEAIRPFASHMQQIIVDEYQDINEIQQFLLNAIRGDSGDIMVVGDPDQTIYEFRGSRPEFMTTEFDQSFEGVHLYNLSNTFRYGHRLSLLANYLIANNPDRSAVLCTSHKSTSDTSIYLEESHDFSRSTINIIESQKDSIALSDIAILNRIWAISAPIELALLEKGIPYQLDHSVSVLDRYELSPFEALLSIAAGNYKALDNPQRTELLTVLLTQPFPKIRRKVLLQIASMAAQFDDNPGKSIRNVMPDNLSNRQADQLLSRTRLIDRAAKGDLTSGQLLQKYFTTSEMEEGIRDSAFSAQQVDDKLETVKTFIRYFQGLELPADQGWQHWQNLREQRKSNQQSGVRLTSMHRSKGLEWPCVIIPGLSERFMPYQPEGELTIPSSVESERRLLYVAMTRAKKRLHLLVPKSSSQSTNKHDSVSPFVYEMAFESSDALGGALSKAKQLDVSVPESHSKIAHRYNERVEGLVNISTITDPVREVERVTYKSAARNTSSSNRKDVNHQVYGKGTVTDETRKSWVIKFDSGIEKQFDKRVASQYLEFVG